MKKTWRNGNCEFISLVCIQWGCFVSIWNTYYFENCAHRSPKWLRNLQWYYSDESPSFAHTLHLGSPCTYPKWLPDWSAGENNGISYGEIIMYASVNISHQDVTFFTVLYGQTTFWFPFLSLCFVYVLCVCFIVSRFVQKENSEKSRGLTFIHYISAWYWMWKCASILPSDVLEKCVYYRIILSKLW